MSASPGPRWAVGISGADLTDWADAVAALLASGLDLAAELAHLVAAMRAEVARRATA